MNKKGKKKKITTYAGKDVNKREGLYAFGRNVKQFRWVKVSTKVSQETNAGFTMCIK